jgi:hypothetical protein
MEAGGGTLTRAALCQQLGVPLVRLGPLVAAMSRVLNVDGFPVVSTDDASESVQLNRELLMRQFGIE